VYKFQYGIGIDMLPLFIGCTQKILENVFKRMSQSVEIASKIVSSYLCLCVLGMVVVCNYDLILCEILLDPNPKNVSKDGDHF
jgi:hypothetical protein